jgi:hypothetical protein
VQSNLEHLCWLQPHTFRHSLESFDGVESLRILVKKPSDSGRLGLSQEVINLSRRSELKKTSSRLATSDME